MASLPGPPLVAGLLHMMPANVSQAYLYKRLFLATNFIVDNVR